MLKQGCQKGLRHFSIGRRALGTLSRQNELGDLPLPELSTTIQQWLLTSQPHLTPNEFNRTQELAGKFLIEAEPLQQYLKEKAANHKNWVSYIYIAQGSEGETKTPCSSEQVEVNLSFLEALGYILNIFKENAIK